MSYTQQGIWTAEWIGQILFRLFVLFFYFNLNF